ncbi:MAG TPA: hypothetical protein ENN08_05300 [Bacteroidales bacterium]|nr:hypothetical protein [Bacteroidales bacterium]
MDNVGNALKSCRQIYSPLGGDCDVDINSYPQWFSNDVHFGTDALALQQFRQGSERLTEFFQALVHTLTFGRQLEQPKPC